MTAQWGQTCSNAPAYNPDGQMVAWPGTDRALQVANLTGWDADTGEPRSFLPAPVAVRDGQDYALGRPALATWDTGLHLAWTGTNNQLNVAIAPHVQPFERIKFTEKWSLPMRSPAGPSIAFFDGGLFLAWIDFEGRIHLSIAPAAAPGSDYTDRVIGETSIDTPALFAFNGAMWLAWTGTDGGQMLNVARGLEWGGHYDKTVFSSDADAFDWGTTPPGPDTSNAGPSLALGFPPPEGGFPFHGFLLSYLGHDNSFIYTVRLYGRPDEPRLFLRRDQTLDTSDFAPAVAWVNGGQVFRMPRA